MTDNRGIGSLSVESHEFMASGLDIFSKPEYDTSLISGKTIEHHMITALNDNNTVFEFVIPSEGQDYTYLPLTRLEGEIQVRRGDGTAVVAADMVAPVNLLASSLFKQVECELNGVQVADLTSPCYPYKAFIETHCTYGADAKNTHLRAALYHKDAAGQEETFTAASTGFAARKAWLIDDNNENTLHFSTPLHLDFFNSQRYLIPGATLKLKFIKNDDKFCLLSATNAWKIKISSLKLFTRKITVEPSIVQQHQALIKTTKAIYPLAMSRIKTFVVNNGINATTIANIFRGKLPRSIIIGMVHSNGFNGDFTKNPFLFKHFGVSYCNLKINGSPLPCSTLQPNFDKGKCIREYRHFLDNIGIQHEMETNNLGLADFKSNTCLFSYDLTPDLCHSFHQHTPTSGYVDLDLNFTAALDHNITVIVYATFNEYVTIDADGQVKLEQ